MWIYLIVSVIVFNVVAIIIPKRLSPIEMYSSTLFALLFEWGINVFLDLKLDLYGYFNVGVDYQAMIPIWGLYPAGNIIILNYYPFKKNFTTKVVYHLGWSVFLTLYEWTTVKDGFFYHHGWKYSWSFFSYIFIIMVLALNLKLIRRVIAKSSK